MIDAASELRSVRSQIQLLRCFQYLRSASRFKRCLNLKSIPLRRLKIVLRAHVRRLERPKENLKDHVRKSIRRWLKLMNGGKRSFLR
jgi:hypothetical protein